MKVELVVSQTCAPCSQAEKLWREIAAERRFDFAIVNLDRPEGQILAERLKLKTIPAIVIDGTLRAIGVQSKHQALELVAAGAKK